MLVRVFYICRTRENLIRTISVGWIERRSAERKSRGRRTLKTEERKSSHLRARKKLNMHH